MNFAPAVPVESLSQLRAARPGAGIASTSSNNSRCQRCLQPGHWTYQCSKPQTYVARPSRTKRLAKQAAAGPGAAAAQAAAHAAGVAPEGMALLAQRKGLADKILREAKKRRRHASRQQLVVTILAVVLFIFIFVFVVVPLVPLFVAIISLVVTLVALELDVIPLEFDIVRLKLKLNLQILTRPFQAPPLVPETPELQSL
nr:Zinc finger CCHC domain-containing protein 10 [Polyrhizophydium stewartii]